MSITAAPFGPLEIAFDHRVLEPREWTTQQSFWGAELLGSLPDGKVLELCCGAGQIGLLTLALRPRPAVLVDKDPVACTFACDNAAAADITDVEVRCADVSEALQDGELFALALVDPPYLRSDQVAQFPDDPVGAVDGGPDGLDLVRSCLTALDTHLLPGGAALLQLAGVEQAEEVADWLAEEGSPAFHVVETRRHGDRGAISLLRGRA